MRRTTSPTQGAAGGPIDREARIRSSQSVARVLLLPHPVTESSADFSLMLMSEMARYDAKVEGFLELRSLAMDVLPAKITEGHDLLAHVDFQSRMIEGVLKMRFAAPSANRLAGVNLKGSAALDGTCDNRPYVSVTEAESHA